MNILAKLKAVPQNLPHGTARRGLIGVAVDKGERYGAAFAFGAAKGYYGEKFIWKGHGLDLWTGLGLQVLGIGANVLSGGRSALAPHLERVGDAGIMSAIDSLATNWGKEKAGRVVAVISPGKNASRLPGKQAVVGAIAPAQAGPYLSAEELARYANRR